MHHNTLSRVLLVSTAICGLGLPATTIFSGTAFSGAALASPKTETRGPNGAAFIPRMDASFPSMSAKFKMTVTPFNLVFLGFQGFFASENIPAAMEFIRAYQNGKITPQSLTKAAIKMNRLSPETLKDKAYLASVQSQLDTLVQDSN